MLITIDTEILKPLIQKQIDTIKRKTRSETPFIDRKACELLTVQLALIEALEIGLYNEAVKTISAGSVPQSTN